MIEKINIKNVFASCSALLFFYTATALSAQHGTYLTDKLDDVKHFLDDRNPKVVGYFQVDYAHYLSTHTRLGDGDEIRRAYLGVVGDVTPDWGYTAIFDFAKNSVHIKDTFIKYSGFRPVTIRIGNMKEPLSLEHLESDINLTFLERALPVLGFFPDRRIGINADTYGHIFEHNYFTASAGLFGVEPGHVTTNEADEGWSVDGRLTFTHQPCDNQLIHLGTFGTIRKPDSNKTLNFSSKPESDITNVMLVNTGTVKNASYYETYGLELAGVQGPFSLQGEYFGTHVNRQANFANLAFKGWYAYGSWFITGESRTYDKQKAIFTEIKPTHNYGAWEVGLRYSDLNLNSHSIIGGQEHDVTVGLNWYINNYVRFMGDFIKVYANQAGVHNLANVYTLRAQISFL